MRRYQLSSQKTTQSLKSEPIIKMENDEFPLHNTQAKMASRKTETCSQQFMYFYLSIFVCFVIDILLNNTADMEVEQDKQG